MSRFVLPALLTTLAVGGPLEAADLVFSPIGKLKLQIASAATDTMPGPRINSAASPRRSWTCEAVLSEAAYLVRDLPGGPEAVLELVARGVVTPTFRLQDEVAAIRALVRRHGRDLADACLVRMSELHSNCVVLTIDTEFRDVYRRHGRKVIPTRLPANAKRRR